MRHSHNTTHTVEVRFFSRQALKVSSILGLSAVVRFSHSLRRSLNPIKQANQFSYSNPFFLRIIPKTQVLIESALTNRAWMAHEAISKDMMLNPVGTIANANLIASQSDREVTKINVLETPYPEMPPVRFIPKDRAVMAKTNSQTPTSTRMRHTAS